MSYATPRCQEPEGSDQELWHAREPRASESGLGTTRWEGRRRRGRKRLGCSFGRDPKPACVGLRDVPEALVSAGEEKLGKVGEGSAGGTERKPHQTSGQSPCWALSLFPAFCLCSVQRTWACLRRHPRRDPDVPLEPASEAHSSNNRPRKVCCDTGTSRCGPRPRSITTRHGPAPPPPPRLLGRAVVVDPFSIHDRLCPCHVVRPAESAGMSVVRLTQGEVR